MMKLNWAIPFLLVLFSCSQKPATTGPRATVFLRDGSSFSGMVVATTPQQLTVAADDKSTRTLDMKDVKAIEYADATPSPEAAKQAERALDKGHDSHDHPEETVIKTKTNVLPASTELAIRTEETIDSKKAVEGQTFAAEVARNVLDADGDLVIPKGANAQIVIKSASKGGRFKGASDLVLDLTSISIGGRKYQIDATDIQKKGRDGVGANRRTAEFGGGGAAIGAVIGAIAGGGKGAAIGAGAGAGAGVLTQILTKGAAIRVPAETILNFRLDAPLRVVAAQ